MGDYKEGYTEAAREYRQRVVPSSDIDRARYDRSKAREARYNDSWMQNPIDLDAVVEQFAPGAVGRRRGVKLVFEGEIYEVRADMPSGYVRIYNKELRKYVLLDGTPSSDRAKTHFKILRREGD